MFACKLCIMEKGLKGSHIKDLPKTEAEFFRHLKEVHGLVVLAQDMQGERVHEYQLEEDTFEKLGLKFYPGYPTPFTRDTAPGAIPSGATIIKTYAEPGDTRNVGARGTVLGSVIHPMLGIAYFVEWDDAPKLAVFVIASKITRTTAA